MIIGILVAVGLFVLALATDGMDDFVTNLIICLTAGCVASFITMGLFNACCPQAIDDQEQPIIKVELIDDACVVHTSEDTSLFVIGPDAYIGDSNTLHKVTSYYPEQWKYWFGVGAETKYKIEIKADDICQQELP